MVDLSSFVCEAMKLIFISAYKKKYGSFFNCEHRLNIDLSMEKVEKHFHLPCFNIQKEKIKQHAPPEGRRL